MGANVLSTFFTTRDSNINKCVCVGVLQGQHDRDTRVRDRIRTDIMSSTLGELNVRHWGDPGSKGRTQDQISESTWSSGAGSHMANDRTH
jgi:hypothetical protein